MASPTEKLKNSKLKFQLIDLTEFRRRDRHKALQGLLVDDLLRERRERQRKYYFVAVDYSADGRSYRDFIQDVSLGGVFIETRESFSEGQEILMILPILGRERPIKVDATIARTEPRGVGVKFRLDSGEQLALIEELLEKL